jgi:hypothetical protein
MKKHPAHKNGQCTGSDKPSQSLGVQGLPIGTSTHQPHHTSDEGGQQDG